MQFLLLVHRSTNFDQCSDSGQVKTGYEDIISGVDQLTVTAQIHAPIQSSFFMWYPTLSALPKQHLVLVFKILLYLYHVKIWRTQHKLYKFLY